jgi:hypothetical protein
MASLEAANLELRLKLRVGDEAKAKEGKHVKRIFLFAKQNNSQRFDQCCFTCSFTAQYRIVHGRFKSVIVILSYCTYVIIDNLVLFL